MLKPLSSVPVMFAGNIKIQNFVEINRDFKGRDTDENLYWGTVREARMVPLSSSSRYTNLMCNLLTSDYSYDISKYWGVYKDIFFSTEDTSDFTVYELLGDKPKSNFNTDFCWGCKRNSFTKNRGCTHTFFAPLWTEGEIPDYFEIKIVVDNKNKEARKLIIPISTEIKPTSAQKPFNYLPVYIQRYCDKLDANVVRLDPEGQCSYIYGTNLQQGGFSMAQNRQVQSLWDMYQPVNLFDYTLSYLYKDAKYVVKQILPLAFSFNLNDLLEGSQKYSTNIRVSGAYYKDGISLGLYRFEYNYTDFNYRYSVPKLGLSQDSSSIVNEYHYTKNIFELSKDTVYNFCLYEGSAEQYKNSSQKYIPYYFKWQLCGSEDEFPYIINLNEAYNQIRILKVYNKGNSVSPNYVNNSYKITGNYHIVPVANQNSIGLYITKQGAPYYSLIKQETSKVFKEIKDYINQGHVRSEDVVTEYNNYCNTWYNVPEYHKNPKAEDNLHFNNAGKLDYAYISGCKELEKNGLIYYKGILYDFKNNNNIKYLRVEHDIKLVENIYGPCYCIYYKPVTDINILPVVYSKDNYTNCFSGVYNKNLQNSLDKLHGDELNCKFYSTQVSYVSEKDYNSAENISKPEIISEVVQLPFPVLQNSDNLEECNEYYVKIPYLSSNKACLNLSEYFKMFRNTTKNWIEGTDSPYRKKLYKYTTNYDSEKENLYYYYKEITTVNPGAEDIFYKVKAKNVNIASYKDNNFFFSEGEYQEEKQNLLQSCRLFNPQKACFEDTPLISPTYMSSQNFERFYDEMINWFEKDSLIEVKNVIYSSKQTVPLASDSSTTFEETINGIPFNNIPYITDESQFSKFDQVISVFSEECLERLNVKIWNKYQVQCKQLFDDEDTEVWASTKYCGYYASKAQVEEYQAYVEKIIEDNYNLIYSHIAKTTYNIQYLNYERKKLRDALTKNVYEYLKLEESRVLEVIEYIKAPILTNYFTILLEQHKRIKFTYRFVPVNNLYDLENVLDRNGHGNLYLFSQALYLPQYYRFDPDNENEQSFQERMVYGFKLVKKETGYFLEIPGQGYSEGYSYNKGVKYSNKAFYIKIDVDLLKVKPYISIYWTDPKQKNITQIEKDYNLFILRYLYPWAVLQDDFKTKLDLSLPSKISDVWIKDKLLETPQRQSSSKPSIKVKLKEKPVKLRPLTLVFGQDTYKIYEDLPDLTGLEFKLYFIDELVSFNNLTSTLDEHFYNLLVNQDANARYWYPVTEECDKVLVPRFKKLTDKELEQPGLPDTLFIFNHDSKVVSPVDMTYTKENSDDNWDQEWNMRLTDFETALEDRIKTSGEYNTDASLSFFCRREMFMNEAQIDSYKDALPFINISGLEYPWICQEKPKNFKESEYDTPDHTFTTFYTVRVPDTRIGFYKNGDKGLIRCNSLIMPDENSLNLFTNLKYTNISVKSIIEDQIKKNPLDLYFCLKKNPLVSLYNFEYSVKPQYYQMNEDVSISKGLDNKYYIVNNNQKNFYRFQRYFGYIKPLLVSEEGPVYAHGKLRSDTRQDLCETTLFLNKYNTSEYSEHIEKYVHKEINPVTRKYTFKENTRNIWEDKWYNDSKVLNLPESIEIVKGVYKESQLNEVENQCQDDFNKYFRQKRFSDPDLLKYLFFNYKVTYNTTPLDTDETGERLYRLTFKFTLL